MFSSVFLQSYGSAIFSDTSLERQNRAAARQAEIKAREEELKMAKNAAKKKNKQTKAEAKADNH